jgi:drug/metabolite transporter (DMT)-like permease
VALGGEHLTLRMLAGGALVLTAMYLVELTPSREPPTEPLPVP